MRMHRLLDLRLFREHAWGNCIHASAKKTIAPNTSCFRTVCLTGTVALSLHHGCVLSKNGASFRIWSLQASVSILKFIFENDRVQWFSFIVRSLKGLLLVTTSVQTFTFHCCPELVGVFSQRALLVPTAPVPCNYFRILSVGPPRDIIESITRTNHAFLALVQVLVTSDHRLHNPQSLPAKIVPGFCVLTALLLEVLDIIVSVGVLGTFD